MMKNQKSKIKNQKLRDLRKKYPRFIYESFNYGIKNGDLKIVFYFIIEPNIKFRPEIIIKNIDKNRLTRIGDKELNNLVFHLGLMEIPSYWKATCSPIIEIQAGYLNKEQIKWWRDLIMNGMGQFFYENKINFTIPNFLKITSTPQISALISEQNLQRTGLCKLKNRVLVPVGGGKDSIVTLELLKKKKFAWAHSHTPSPHTRTSSVRGKLRRGLRFSHACFMVNPTKAARDIVKAARIKDSIIIRRTIDPRLLELNKKGYLNGHTPITAVLSFLSVFCAVLFNYKNIAFSNEKSADEGNVKYLGKIINHQWSKSSEFEKKFRNYCKKYLAKNVNYFSFLRQYTELEIAKMFTKYPKYFSVFSSCNVVLAKKMDSTSSPQVKKRWCGNCPKCLFVYAILYPFLEKEQLLKIFGKDIFENRGLLTIMYQLIGKRFAWAHSHTPSPHTRTSSVRGKLRRGLRFSHAKPFECVGTKRESREAFELCLKKAKKLGKIPYLLALH